MNAPLSFSAPAWLASPEAEVTSNTVPYFDYLVHLTAKVPDQVEVTAHTTASIRAVLTQFITSERSRCQFACETLGGVIDALKVRETYSAHYRDYLIGAISEAQLEKVAATVTYSPIDREPKELSERLDLLLRFTTSDFTASETAELFGTNEQSIAEAVKQLQLPFTRSLYEADAE